MKYVVLALLVVSTFSGCRTVQQPIQLDQGYWTHKPESVGVVVAKLPHPTAVKMGNQGLIDVAINNAMADSLTKHLNSLSIDDFRESAKVIAAHFSEHGVTAKLIEEDLDVSTLPKVKDAPKDFARVDYTGLKAKYGVEQLVVMHVTAAGTVRSYYGFIPTSAPQGYFSCDGELIDLSNNRLLWLARAQEQIPIDNPWDQPADAYPHVTTAFYRALETGKTALVSDFVGSAPAHQNPTH